MLKRILILLILLFNCSIFAQEEETNSLKILSEPKGARVYLNSEFTGTTPLVLNDLKMDNYHIVVALNDSLKIDKYYFYRGGKRELFYILDGDYGLLDILTQPENAQLFINDSLIGTTPQIDLKVPTGITKIRIEKEDYETIEQALAVKKQSYVFNRSLKYKYGFLNIPDNITNLHIKIDGERKNPGSQILEIGAHSLRLTTPAYHKPVNRQFIIESNKRYDVEFNYNYFTPKYIFYSAFLPGFGQFLDKSKLKGLGYLALNAAAAAFYLSARSEYDERLASYNSLKEEYDQAATEEAAIELRGKLEIELNKTNDSIDKKNLGLMFFIGAYLVNLADAALFHSNGADVEIYAVPSVKGLSSNQIGIKYSF